MMSSQGQEGGDRKWVEKRDKDRSGDISLHHLDSWIQPCLKHLFFLSFSKLELNLPCSV